MKMTELQEMTNEQLVNKKEEILIELRKLPSYSVHRRDLNKALQDIDRERLRRAWQKEEKKK